MKVIAATKNKGKIREMQEILAPLDIEIVSQQELGIDVDVEETGDTFVKNAIIDNATDEDRINKLLTELGDNENRRAKFVTSVAFIMTDGTEITAEGEVKGTITKEPKGENGFGYDPIFLSDELGKTFAESSDEEKNSISHRGRALKNLYDKLKKMN